MLQSQTKLGVDWNRFVAVVNWLCITLNKNENEKKKHINCWKYFTVPFFFYKLGNAFSPGSYAYAEEYELNYPEKRVIKAAEIVREQNIYLHIGKGWEDKDSTDYWHHIYFNFHNRMLLTWTRPKGENKTTFAFVRIENKNSEWKDLNNDFWFFENRKIKKALKEEILDKMIIELEKK